MHPPTMVVVAAAVVPRPPWCLTPGAAAYDNQPTLWVTVVCGGAGSGAPWGALSAMSQRDGRRCGVVVGCVLLRNTYSSIPDNQRCLPDEVRKSIPIGIGAVGSAASTPNRSILRIHRFEASWRHDACRRCRCRRQNRIRRRGFLSVSHRPCYTTMRRDDRRRVA